MYFRSCESTCHRNFILHILKGNKMAIEIKEEFCKICNLLKETIGEKHIKCFQLCNLYLQYEMLHILKLIGRNELQTCNSFKRHVMLCCKGFCSEECMLLDYEIWFFNFIFLAQKSIHVYRSQESLKVHTHKKCVSVLCK